MIFEISFNIITYFTYFTHKVVLKSMINVRAELTSPQKFTKKLFICKLQIYRIWEMSKQGIGYLSCTDHSIFLVDPPSHYSKDKAGTRRSST